LAAFEAEAAWIIGDWATVEKASKSGHPMAIVMLALHRGEDLPSSLQAARRALGNGITSKQFSRAYDSILGLHMLREVEMIHQTAVSLDSPSDPINRQVIQLQLARDLRKSLSSRFDTASPAFRHREAILSIRRTAFSTVKASALQPEIGRSWIVSSKIARKAGYEQTAYSATLQAKEANAEFAFIQQAKLSRAHGGALKALNDLENALRPLLSDATGPAGPGHPISSSGPGGAAEQFERDRNLAKVRRGAAEC
jgi:serine/threonine-protein kinase ATR